MNAETAWLIVAYVLAGATVLALFLVLIGAGTQLKQDRKQFPDDHSQDQSEDQV